MFNIVTEDDQTLAADSNSSCKLCPLMGFNCTFSLLVSIFIMVVSIKFSVILLRHCTNLRIVRLNKPSNCVGGKSNSSANLSTILCCKPNPNKIA